MRRALQVAYYHRVEACLRLAWEMQVDHQLAYSKTHHARFNNYRKGHYRQSFLAARGSVVYRD